MAGIDAKEGPFEGEANVEVDRVTGVGVEIASKDEDVSTVIVGLENRLEENVELSPVAAVLVDQLPLLVPLIEGQSTV